MRRFYKRGGGVRNTHPCPSCISADALLLSPTIVIAFKEIIKSSVLTRSKGKLEFIHIDWFLFYSLLHHCVQRNLSTAPSLRVGIKLWLSYNVFFVKMSCFHRHLPNHYITGSSRQQRGERKMIGVWRSCQALTKGNGLLDTVPLNQ